MHRPLALLLLLAPACSSDGDSPTPGPGLGPPEGTTTTGLDVTTSLGGTTVSEPEPESESDTGGTTCSFICEIDAGSGTHECDPFAQDCDPGMKCLPWANDGGSSWNGTRCSTIDDNPDQSGDECTVEGSGTSGIDSCDLGLMCWDVDPETNVGTCVPMCTGDESNPICDDPNTTCAITNDGAIILCLPACDPLLQDCAPGQACYPVADAWACAPDASGEMGVYGDPCEFINVCDPGYACLAPGTVPAGESCDDAGGCCSAICDLDDPMASAQCEGAAAGQICLPWYEEGSAPPGLENVGACALPL